MFKICGIFLFLKSLTDPLLHDLIFSRRVCILGLFEHIVNPKTHYCQNIPKMHWLIILKSVPLHWQWPFYWSKPFDPRIMIVFWFKSRHTEYSDWLNDTLLVDFSTIVLRKWTFEVSVVVVGVGVISSASTLVVPCLWNVKNRVHILRKNHPVLSFLVLENFIMAT